MVLLPFRLNTGTYASNLRTFVWPHRENQIFTMWPSKAKFPAGAHPGKLYFWGGGPADILPFRQDTDQSVPCASIVSSFNLIILAWQGECGRPCIADRTP